MKTLLVFLFTAFSTVALANTELEGRYYLTSTWLHQAAFFVDLSDNGMVNIMERYCGDDGECDDIKCSGSYVVKSLDNTSILIQSTCENGQNYEQKVVIGYGNLGLLNRKQEVHALVYSTAFGEDPIPMTIRKY